MDQALLNGIPKKQQSLIAVAYLMTHIDERPAGSQVLFDKIDSYYAMARATNEEIKKAQQHAQQQKMKLQQLIGSLNTMSDLISENLDDDLVAKCCLAYDMNEMAQSNIPPDMTMFPTSTDTMATQAPAPVPVDMAGVTAKTIPPLDEKALAKGV